MPRTRRLGLGFPSNPPHPCEVPRGFFDGLGIGSRFRLFFPRKPKCFCSKWDPTKKSWTFPRLPTLLSVKDRMGAQGVIVTASGPEGFDFCSRYFGPWEGLNEDPVTGSAHTVLAPYWHEILGKSDFLALQASRRTGVLRVRLVPGGKSAHLRESIFLKGILCL